MSGAFFLFNQDPTSWFSAALRVEFLNLRALCLGTVTGMGTVTGTGAGAAGCEPPCFYGTISIELTVVSTSQIRATSLARIRMQPIEAW